MKAFRNSTLKEGNAPQAAILYDKFHIVAHLNKAIDKVRRQEYASLSGGGRQFIKGQRFAASISLGQSYPRRQGTLKLLFPRQPGRLYKAYLLKESFDQLWEYQESRLGQTIF